MKITTQQLQQLVERVKRAWGIPSACRSVSLNSPNFSAIVTVDGEDFDVSGEFKPQKDYSSYATDGFGVKFIPDTIFDSMGADRSRNFDLKVRIKNELEADPNIVDKALSQSDTSFLRNESRHMRITKRQLRRIIREAVEPDPHKAAMQRKVIVLLTRPIAGKRNLMIQPNARTADKNEQAPDVVARYEATTQEIADVIAAEFPGGHMRVAEASWAPRSPTLRRLANALRRNGIKVAT